MFLPKLARAFVLPGFAALALLGCAAEDTSADGEDETGETGDGGTTGDGDGDTSGDGDGDGDGDDPVPLDQRPARGITINQVEANQGTAIIIGEGGEWIPGEDRLGPLVRDRNTLVRLHYELDPAWIPREIEARLILEFADGTSKTLLHKRMVDAPSAPNSLSQTFYFGLVGAEGEVMPDSNFKVELHEVSDGAGDTLAEGIWQTPATPALFGVQPEPLELKIVFVPWHHQYQDIDRMVDTSDANMQVIADSLLQQFAVTEVVWEVHEPLVWDNPMENLGSVLGPTSALRDNEMAFPNVYYHALFPVPNGGVAGVAGIASVAGDTKGDGNSRVSATAFSGNIGNNGDVVTHEVGHNAGMQHAYCPFANAASPDPTYPYENGLIGQWGFGIVSFQLHSPENTYDYMSYCGPSWVSTWSWNKTFTRQRILTGWDFEDASGGGLDFDLGPTGYAENDLLIGSIGPNGDEFWWTAHGTLPSDPYGTQSIHHIELRSEGELVAVLPAVVTYTNEFSNAWLTTELPPELAKLEGIDEIVRIDDQAEAHPVARARVQLSKR